MNPRSPWFVAGFLAGAASAAASALLTAPARGSELIEMLKEHIAQAREEARVAGQRAEADVLTRYKAIRNASGAPQLSATSGVYISPATIPGAPASAAAAGAAAATA